MEAGLWKVDEHLIIKSCVCLSGQNWHLTDTAWKLKKKCSKWQHQNLHFKQDFEQFKNIFVFSVFDLSITRKHLGHFKGMRKRRNSFTLHCTHRKIAKTRLNLPCINIIWFRLNTMVQFDIIACYLFGEVSISLMLFSTLCHPIFLFFGIGFQRWRFCWLALD